MLTQQTVLSARLVTSSKGRQQQAAQVNASMSVRTNSIAMEVNVKVVRLAVPCAAEARWSAAKEQNAVLAKVLIISSLEALNVQLPALMVNMKEQEHPPIVVCSVTFRV